MYTDSVACVVHTINSDEWAVEAVRVCSDVTWADHHLGHCYCRKLR